MWHLTNPLCPRAVLPTLGGMELSVSTVRHTPGAPPPAADLADFADLSRRTMLALYGDDDLADTPAELGTVFVEQAYHRKVMLLARDGDRALGGLWARMPLRDNTSVAYLSFVLDPERDPGDVVAALWAQVLPVVREEGRSTVQVWSDHAPDPEGEQLAPRTGVGTLPRDRYAAALLDLGLNLEQVERHSLVETARGVELATGELPAARAAAGTAYRTLGWVGATPPELRSGLAALMGRMSTDAPSADLELEPEVWDADRVAEVDRIGEALGRTRVMTVAEHVASGELVAYTCVDLPGDKPAVGYQEDTLVHAGHRGHRLGMLVKAENLHRIAEHAPAVQRLHTWNADENGHMLAINLALGFRPASYGGGWQVTGV